MAGFTFGRDVFATQHVFRVAVMVESGSLPVFLDVTGFAFVAESPLVAFLVIVGTMTGDARLLEFFHVQDSCMAGFTLGRDVLATQHIFRVAVMVKGRDGPVLFGVTGLALFAEATLVAFLVVVGLVAGHAGDPELFLI